MLYIIYNINKLIKSYGTNDEFEVSVFSNKETSNELLTLEKFNNFDSFYKVIESRINPIKLEKKIIEVKTYEYYTNRNIKVKNIITYLA